jgi:hypothetical protein
MVHLAPAKLAAKILKNTGRSDGQGDCNAVTDKLAPLATGKHHGVLAFTLNHILAVNHDRRASKQMVTAPMRKIRRK